MKIVSAYRSIGLIVNRPVADHELAEGERVMPFLETIPARVRNDIAKNVSGLVCAVLFLWGDPWRPASG